jgi:hypothetical protein
MRAIEEFISLVYSKFEQTRLFITLVKMEVKLAGLSVFPLLVTLSFIVVVGLTLWFSSMLILGMTVYVMYPNPMIATASILLLNLGCLLVLVKYLLYNLKNMSFSRTRKLLVKHEEQHSNAQAEKADHTVKQSRTSASVESIKNK